MFLGQFIVMTLLVTWLFVETQRSSPYERRFRRRCLQFRSHSVGEQLCLIATVTFFFAISYIGRLTLNEYFSFYCYNNNASLFDQEVAHYVCYLVEGLSMGSLMGVHAYYKFKTERMNRPASVV